MPRNPITLISITLQYRLSDIVFVLMLMHALSMLFVALLCCVMVVAILFACLLENKYGLIKIKYDQRGLNSTHTDTTSTCRAIFHERRISSVMITSAHLYGTINRTFYL